MSISRRSLALVLACGLVLVCWMISRAAGPSLASADPLGPFPDSSEAISKVAAAQDSVQPIQADDNFMSEGAGSPGSLSAFLLVDEAGESQPQAVTRLLGEHRAAIGLKLHHVAQTPQWTADMDGDGQLNESDVTAFQELWDWADAGADFNQDGVVDPFDYADFVVAYDQRQQRPASITIFDASQFNTRLRMGEAKPGDVVSIEFQVQIAEPVR